MAVIVLDRESLFKGSGLRLDRVAPIAISVVAFILALVGVLLGSTMQRMLPESQLTSGSKEIIKLSIGVVATLVALVLGFLVASAKSTYDARKSEVSQIAADVMLLDYLFARYGDDSKAARAALRQAVPPTVDRIWRERQSVPLHAEPYKPVHEGEVFYQQVQRLQPANGTQRGLQTRIVQITDDLMQLRFLLFSHLRGSIPPHSWQCCYRG